ncbi:MAG TPA: alpha/beta hydrolase-fold protein [Longimicrobiales bacterium]|nr:alpha/beta hydrolase-fold protein [Longimicrobiales bacterium]
MTMPHKEALPAEVYIPTDAGDGVPVVVLLHGRGSDRTDLFSMRPFFPPEWAVIAPDAPFAAEPWGYGPGRAWYRYLGRNTPEPESFTASLQAIDRLLDALPDTLGRQPGPVGVGGFSQGGTVSLGYALSHPDRSLDVLNFSGFLADHPSVVPAPDAVANARIFWGHGTADPAIPFELAIEGRELLREAGADLEARDYAIGHSISQDELHDAVAWLERGLSARS